MNNKFRVGDIVKSASGHDKNRLFVVISIDKNGFLGIIDCKHRTKSNPKRKNPKHLVKLGHNEKVIEKLNSYATNKEVYKLIKSTIKE